MDANKKDISQNIGVKTILYCKSMINTPLTTVNNFNMFKIHTLNKIFRQILQKMHNC